MNRERLIITRLGGELCRPRPERRKDSATTKRVKLVTMISRPGATERIVKIATNWMMRPVADAPPPGTSEPRSIVCALALAIVRTSKAAAMQIRFTELPGFG